MKEIIGYVKNMPVNSNAHIVLDFIKSISVFLGMRKIIL